MKRSEEILNQILLNFSTPYWVKGILPVIWDKDPLDVWHDLRSLADLFEVRLEEEGIK